MGKPATDVFLDEKTLMQKWANPEGVYLIVDQRRAAHWQRVLTDRFHIFHQVTICGTYVVLSNEL